MKVTTTEPNYGKVVIPRVFANVGELVLLSNQDTEDATYGSEYQDFKFGSVLILNRDNFDTILLEDEVPV